MWKVLKKFWTEFDQKFMASDELLLVRRLKLMSMGLMDQLPEQYPDDLVEVPVRTLAMALGIPRSKIRIRIFDFHSKRRTSTVSDDPVIIEKIKNYCELTENSTQVHQKVYIFG
jgi:hypothetical protein